MGQQLYLRACRKPHNYIIIMYNVYLFVNLLIIITIIDMGNCIDIHALLHGDVVLCNFCFRFNSLSTVVRVKSKLCVVILSIDWLVWLVWVDVFGEALVTLTRPSIVLHIVRRATRMLN